MRYLPLFLSIGIVGLLTLVLSACDQSSSDILSTSNNNITQNFVYIRDNGKRAINVVDVSQNRVIRTLDNIGAGAFNNGMIVAPNGKLYILRGQFGGGSYDGRALLIVDPNKNWQRKEIQMTDDVPAIAISPNGKAFISHEIIQQDRTFNLDVYDTANDTLIATLHTPGRVEGFTIYDDIMYFFQDTSGQPETAVAHLRGIRTSDLQQVFDMPLPRFRISDIRFGKDGTLYAVVHLRSRNEDIVSNTKLEDEQVGLLLEIDTKAQRVISELPIPRDPFKFIITQDNKAYIIHYDTIGTGETNSLSIYDLNKRSVVKQGIKVGVRPLDIAQVGLNKAYIANQSYTAAGLGCIYVIDTRTDTVIGTFSAGDHPNSIAVPPTP